MIVTQLRIGTWNVLGRQIYRQGRSAAAGRVREILTDTGVDVLSIQEVHFYDGEPDPQLRSELREVGLCYFKGKPFSGSHLDTNAQLGVGIASRFPLSDETDYQLYNPGLTAMVRGTRWVLHDKGLVGARVHLDGHRSLWVYALHLFPFFEFGVPDDDERVGQMWDEFWRYADKEGREGRTVLAGDYNQTNRKNAADGRVDLPWTFCAADRATTVTGLSVDDVVVNWGDVTPPVEVVPTFSDHHLVVATLGV